MTNTGERREGVEGVSPSLTITDIQRSAHSSEFTSHQISELTQMFSYNFLPEIKVKTTTSGSSGGPSVDCDSNCSGSSPGSEPKEPEGRSQEAKEPGGRSQEAKEPGGKESKGGGGVVGEVSLVGHCMNGLTLCFKVE